MQGAPMARAYIYHRSWHTRRDQDSLQEPHLIELASAKNLPQAFTGRCPSRAVTIVVNAFLKRAISCPPDPGSSRWFMQANQDATVRTE